MVSGGSTWAAIGMSSKPTTEIVGRDAQAGVAHPAQGPMATTSLATKTRRRAGPRPQQLGHPGMVAAGRVEGALHHERRIEIDAGRLEGIAVAGQPFGRRRVVEGRVGDAADPAMAEAPGGARQRRAPRPGCRRRRSARRGPAREPWITTGKPSRTRAASSSSSSRGPDTTRPSARRERSRPAYVPSAGAEGLDQDPIAVGPGGRGQAPQGVGQVHVGGQLLGRLAHHQADRHGSRGRPAAGRDRGGGNRARGRLPRLALGLGSGIWYVGAAG